MKIMSKPGISISLPSWADSYLENEMIFSSDEEKVAFAIDLACRNIRNKTGGPFGSAIFEYQSGKLVSVGMNLVTTAGCSVCHAEIVAIICAQKRIGSFDLSSGSKKYVLAASTEPCAMCLGAIPWSGVSKIICAARDEDARAIGFDEGPKPRDWQSELEKRNIQVVMDVLRDRAGQILTDYVEKGGQLYNAGNSGL